MRHLSIVLLTSLLAAQPCLAAADAVALTACMTKAASELGFNGSILARLGSEPIARAFGTSDADARIPITAKTRFSVGSASKMFTAVAIGRLVDRGLVAFDAPIGRYLEGLAPDVAAITVAQLLNHTSGLGDYLNPRDKAAIDAAITATDLLPLALAAPRSFAPGSARAYSNSGFVVLGAIIEKISGMSYASFVQKEIVAPLGMSDTRFTSVGGAEPMTRMSPAGMLDKPRPSPLRSLRASPAGGMYSTTADMSVFLTALTAGRLVSHATMAALFEPRTAPGGTGMYGYGFNVQVGPPRRVGHGGGAPGVNSEFALYPQSGWQLIAMSNYDPPTASRMITVLERALFASEPATACDVALADPALRAPMVMRRP